MYAFLLVLLVLVGIFLSVIILLQAGKGGGLAAMGGGVTATEGVLGGRQATTFLTRATWAAGTLFMVLAFTLSILSSRNYAPQSILRTGVEPVTAPAPVLPGLEEGAPPPAALPPEGGAGGGETTVP